MQSKNEVNQSDTNTGTLITSGRKAMEQVIFPIGASFLNSYSLFYFLTSVFEGYPTLVPKVAKELARYQIPAVAVPVVILGVLQQLKVDGTKIPHNVVLSIMNGLGVANFSVPLVMEVVTAIVHLVKHESPDADVQIPNWAAGLLIGFCGITGLAQAIQSYSLKINAEHPEQTKSLINTFSTSQLALIIFALINSASSYHGLTMSLMNLFAVDTAANGPYYARLGLTASAAAIGGFILGRPEPETRFDAQLFKASLNLAQITALAIDFSNTFYLSPHAEAVFGKDVIEEQTILWAAVIPLIPVVITLLQLIGLKGPQLWQAFNKTLSELIGSFNDDANVLEHDSLDINSANAYGSYENNEEYVVHIESDTASQEHQEEKKPEAFAHRLGQNGLFRQTPQRGSELPSVLSSTNYSLSQ